MIHDTLSYDESSKDIIENAAAASTVESRQKKYPCILRPLAIALLSRTEKCLQASDINGFGCGSGAMQ